MLCFSATWLRRFSNGPRARSCSCRAHARSARRPTPAPPRHAPPLPRAPPKRDDLAHARELILRNQHATAHATGREREIYFGFGRAGEVALDHEGAEAPAFGFGHVRPA